MVVGRRRRGKTKKRIGSICQVRSTCHTPYAKAGLQVAARCSERSLWKMLVLTSRTNVHVSPSVLQPIGDGCPGSVCHEAGFGCIVIEEVVLTPSELLRRVPGR